VSEEEEGVCLTQTQRKVEEEEGDFLAPTLRKVRGKKRDTS
jgi:hypothetical protein